MTKGHDPSALPATAGATGTGVAGSGVDDDSEAARAGGDPADRLLAALNDGVARVLRAFDEKIRYDATKQQAIDRQHEELLGHRADLVARAAHPFIYGMIQHHAEVGRLLAAVREKAAVEMLATKVCELLESLQEDVERILGENGVAAYRAEASEPFDPARQTVVGKARPTSDEALSGTVAACLGTGFERDGRILCKARVSAYRFQASPPSPDSRDAELSPGRSRTGSDAPATGLPIPKE